MVNIFVYGSLMKTYWNHKLIKNEIFVGNGVLKGYAMYQVHAFPGIIKTSKENDYILGEVYKINESILKKLDYLESEGTMYIRKNEKVVVDDNEIDAYVYVWNYEIKKGCQKVEEKPWRPKGEEFL